MFCARQDTQLVLQRISNFCPRNSPCASDDRVPTAAAVFLAPPGNGDLVAGGSKREINSLTEGLFSHRISQNFVSSAISAPIGATIFRLQRNCLIRSDCFQGSQESGIRGAFFAPYDTAQEGLFLFCLVSVSLCVVANTGPTFCGFSAL